ncbi:hypothetical protein [Microbulbifer sp. 2205BS26-8]|uniref:hypothetical protein n=1 Tax=Microbulbifer sp. 2205BS26-8 TaxID=3064386 RepID=UPI00273ED945|nr:hypothetical protein [Microbulbifer sp. 2205BS26-8]MDP5210372.1 hypothetical protein [Microbulbifer sp. 2205BS26-8]
MTVERYAILFLPLLAIFFNNCLKLDDRPVSSVSKPPVSLFPVLSIATNRDQVREDSQDSFGVTPIQLVSFAYLENDTKVASTWRRWI